MSARKMPYGSPRPASRVILAVLFSLTAGLGLLVPASQPALAASQGSTSIARGSNHACAVESGTAYCWGSDDDGQLGDGSTLDSSIPVAVNTSGALAGKTLTQIAGGADFTCALDSTGHAYCWGNDDHGQLGDGSTSSVIVPVAVDTSGVLAGKTLTQIATGADFTCALDSAGAAYCWGGNDFGGLGDGSTSDSNVPVAVDTSGVLAGKTLTQIAVGDYHGCALDSLGAAYCWGWNAGGQLGNGNTADSSVPVAVDTSGVLAGKTLTQITGGSSTCALDASGAAYCWGDNSTGQLGDGSTTGSSVPVAVDASGVLAGKTLTGIATGPAAAQACAVDSAGKAYCWGYDQYGQLGNGTTAFDSTVPVAVDTSGVLAGKTLTQIAIGGTNTCAVDTDGALYCWGSNALGSLGDGSTTQSDVPVLTGPSAPAKVAAVPGNTAATLSWTTPASLDGGTLTGYTATASPGGQACTTTSAASCTITGLANGTTYTITVVAHTTAGDSGASAPATVTPEPEGGATGPIVSGDRPTKCADDSRGSAANDTPIVISDCNGSPEQNWTIAPGGTIQVNGKCMDIYRDKKTNKAPVELWTCTGGANQQWKAAGGTLVNPVSGKCLDDPRFNTTDGTQLEIYTCNGGANQQWIIP
jgi:alpha-tubulin suppressor-like RCC1 family protein